MPQIKVPTTEPTPISDKEVKIAKDVMKIIAMSDIQMGARDTAKEPERYKETALRIIKLLHKENVLKSEVELIRQLIFQATSIAYNAVMGSIELSENLALKSFWGKHPDEVTLQDIDNKMKLIVPDKNKKDK